MDSRSRRLPFCLSSSRSPYTPSPTVSSSLGSSRLYSRDPVLSNDRFPRASSPYKPDIDKQNSRLLSSTRDYSSSDTRSPSWKLPSLTSSNRSYDRPWAESSLSSRSKVTDSERRLGISSGFLDASDDADFKRAKLSYSNRGLYSRTPSTSVTGSTYSSNGLSSGRIAGEKQSDSRDSSRSSYSLLSRPSPTSTKSLLSTREQEVKTEPSLLGLGERRVRTPGLTSSLYQTDRVLSTYAQGARPKETTYAPSSLSSTPTAREGTLNRHSLSSASQQTSPLPRDVSSRNATRFRNGSPALYSSQEQTRNSESSDVFSSYSSHTSWYSTPQARPEATPSRPAPESGVPDGRSSTRRLLSRLFSRRSSQDSSSGSSSVRSVEDDSPSTGGESVDSDEGARVSIVDADIRAAETTMESLRNHRADLSPIQEGNSDGPRSGPSQRRMASWREPSVSSGGGRSSSWLSSSLRGRCPPLLSRLRRYARDEGTQTSSGYEEGHSRPQPLLRRWDDLEHKTLEDEDDDDDDDDDDEDDEEEEGAVGVEAFDAIQGPRLENEMLPELEEIAVRFSPRRRVGIFDNISVSVGALGSVERPQEVQKDKPVSSGDQEKLRKIKERLLLEESDEEEGDLCRICQMREESSSNPLIQPCRCTGSLQFVHQDCIKRWLRSKIGSGTNLEAITTCELCKDKLRLNIDNFDIHELYRAHMQSEYDEFISSGLYLVVLLHFCEQRFSDVLRAVDAAGLFNLVRILHEHMDSLETSHGDSDEEGRDGRPSVDFSDLDDDLDEY